MQASWFRETPANPRVTIGEGHSPSKGTAPDRLGNRGVVADALDHWFLRQPLRTQEPQQTDGVSRIQKSNHPHLVEVMIGRERLTNRSALHHDEAGSVAKRPSLVESLLQQTECLLFRLQLRRPRTGVPLIEAEGR